ncbi:hypothetical protein BGZ60DRAFT_534031 [Tricladium varicosporioides]|nr:hypothetical protein BGZ60DRAFT_534031 [Hymenoscyphus varicosporioides]
MATSQSSPVSPLSCAGTTSTPNSTNKAKDNKGNALTNGLLNSLSTTGSSQVQVAICGIGLRLPGGIRDGDGFWDLLINGKDARGPIPITRYNADGFDNSLGARDAINLKNGYFLDEELSGLDTSFFTLTKNELENCDPQQRMLLEVTRECLEDAGEVNYRGQLIGCYVGTFGDDWLLMNAKDFQQGNGYSVTGHGDLMMANRVSYEYDFRGPSMAIKTGCSASLTALHEAVRAIQCGDATAAIVAGTSLIMTPAITAAMTTLELLSPGGSCKTFDAAADGFARAEAISAIYIKSLEDAIRDGNAIRAIIRGTATNSDGRGQGLVIPNEVAQEALIRGVYAESGLDPSDTTFVECHGTGTAKGDPIEANAIGNVFGVAGVYIGSVKPNLGHSEGASGITSVIKSVLALEHQTIPPNIKFETPNPKILFSDYKLTVPVIPTPFPPDRPKRISVNSFGIGGTNAHVILESFTGTEISTQAVAIGGKPELLLFSANTEISLKEQVRLHQEYIRSNSAKSSDLAYTRAIHREHLPHRAFALMENGEFTEISSGLKASHHAPAFNMVFSGQGAQWPEMGKELILTDHNFRVDILKMDQILQGLKLPPKWNLMDELLKPSEVSQIHRSELSQPLCTALQVALYNKFAALGIVPAAVVGHSSGEIAAAYASGYVSMEEAIIIAYYRGYVTMRQTLDGSMAAVGLGSHELSAYLSPGVVLACENSPNSSTISGDSTKVLEITDLIKQKSPDTLVRILKVDMAYHSDHMKHLSQEYQRLLEEELQNIEALQKMPKIPFFSSVTCKMMSDTPLDLSYWVTNLISPVRFSSAVLNLVSFNSSGIFLEIGPHSTLAGPLRQICTKNNHIYKYIPGMVRNKNCSISLLSAIGQLYQEGMEIDFNSLYTVGKSISGLPTYPWDHTTLYWNENRISKAWRTQKFAHHCLLGSRILEVADTEPQWRNVLHIEDEAWLADHKIDRDIVFPFAGYVALAGEAIRQTTHSSHDSGYRLRHIIAHTALLLSYSQRTELITSLRRRKLNETEDTDWFDFSIMSYTGSTWVKHCDGQVTLLNSARPSYWNPETMSRRVNSSRFYNEMAKIGFVYGPEFQRLVNISSSTTEEFATSQITNQNKQTSSIFTLHPTNIDACLQLLIVAMAKGLERNIIELSMPTSIEDIEISSGMDVMDVRAWSSFGGKNLACVECVAHGKIVLRASGIQLRPLEDNNSSEKGDIHAAARLEWLPDFYFLDVAKLFSLPKSERIETRLQEEMALLCIFETAEKIKDLAPCQPHFVKFRRWLNKQISLATSGTYELVEASQSYGKLTSGERRLMIDERVSSLMHMSRHAVTVGLKRIFDNVEKIFTGEVDTLEILLEENILARIYDIISFDYAPFILSLAHSKPNLRILEVGAGTGGTTATILHGLMNAGGLPTYSTYTFTDISAGFFPAAKERFAYASNLEFKVFDISKDPFEQGFEESSYDVILAVNVIHATPFLKQTLGNLQPLLRPDGMLVMTEICSSSRGSSFIFGNFSGWWLGEADGREDQPHVSISRWDEDLKASGFMGIDTTIYDDEEPYRQCAVIVSKKEQITEIQQTPKVTILSTIFGGEVARSLADYFLAKGWEVTKCQLGDDLPKDQDIISCLDLETNFFENITEGSFTTFQLLLRSLSTEKILWLTPVAQMKCRDPRSAQSLGVIPTIRTELALQFHTLEISSNEPEFASLVANVFIKIQKQDDRDNLESDKEFVVDNGVVFVGRYQPFSLVEELRTKSNERYNNTMKYLEIEKPGRLDTLTWKTKPIPEAIPKTHIEVAVYHVGLNFRDIAMAMGIISLGEPHVNLGLEVVGIVQRIGHEVTKVVVGDRVMAFTIRGGFSTNVILAEHHVFKIPDSMSYEEAATIQTTLGTVIYALLDIGRLSKGQTVLIHSACGGVGLAAIQVCQMMGAEIFATVGTEHKREYLGSNYGIPRHRVFSSRDASFYEDLMRETNGIGVDLVLNSLSGELLHESWKCVAPNGKLLELGKRDLEGSGQLDMRHFLGNRSYCAIDMFYQIVEHPLMVQDILQRTLDLCEQGLLKPIQPVTQFAAADVKRAFRNFQAGDHIGKFIVKFPTDASLLQSSLNIQPIQFRPDAAYLLVSGLRGLGKSLATWMIERGARNLLFLSRSAGLSEESKAIVEELESMGSSITMIRGSVDDIEDVERAVAASKKPIKGVFQLAMIQRDGPFIDMKWVDWITVNKPKVKGTWNLHQTLLGHTLDFFWMASSIVTVIGQAGQGNYKAANTFMEAFSQYRHSLGLPASVLGICPIDNAGFFTQNPWAVRVSKSQGQYFLGEKEFLDYVEASLLNSSPQGFDDDSQPTVSSPGLMPPWKATGHIVMGLRSELHLDDPKNTTNWRRDCRMGMYHNIPIEEARDITAESTCLKQFLESLVGDDARKILADETSIDFLALETGQKIYDFLLKPDTEVNIEHDLSQIGLDSLTAIELRRWFRQAFGLQVSVLEIMRSGSLRQLGGVLAGKLSEKHG